MFCYGGRRHTKRKERQHARQHDKHGKNARWMEIIIDIAVTHPQRADVWGGIWSPSLRQTLKSRFEDSSDYANALTNLLEKELVFFRKVFKKVSKTLAEAVSELWIELAAAIKQIEQIEQAQS